MYCKVTVYENDNIIVFYDEVSKRSFWRSYFLSEMSEHRVLGFSIITEG